MSSYLHNFFSKTNFFFQNLCEIRNRKYNPVNLAKHRFSGQQNYVIIIKRIFSTGDIQKVRLPKIPDILPPLPARSLLFVFEHPPASPSLRYASVPILVKFREKKLIIRTSFGTSFGWTHFFFKKPQRNLYKVDTISAWQNSLRYGEVRFIESLSKNQKSWKVNMKSTVCNGFRSSDLLEGPKDGKIKENAKFFSFKVSKQVLLH